MKEVTVKLRLSPDDVLDVGTLAEQDRRVYFQYADSFLATRLELSPYKLPLRAGLLPHEDTRFGLLPGLFDDSLPDGWGLLLMDRHFRRRGLDPASLSPLDRLLYLGGRTMGALTYHPPANVERDEQAVDLYKLGRNAEQVLAGQAVDVLPELMRAGGSPAGARPKVLVGLQGDRVISGEDDLPAGYEHWMVKFAAKADSGDAGPVEYAYSLMARACGIELPPTRLFELREGSSIRRYFAVRRFDRPAENRRTHVHTFGNLIHVNFRVPSCDYTDVFKVVQSLTHSHRDVLRMFRLMAFNVFAHNRDDHAKNFAFLLDEKAGEWALSPAYDLTFASGPGGEHTCTILGEGLAPSANHMTRLAEQVGIGGNDASQVIDEVAAMVSQWPRWADEAGCRKKVTADIGRRLASG